MKLGIPVLLACAGFGFCFLVLELGLRLMGFDPMREAASGRGLILRESANPLRIYELTPNAKGKAWHTDVEINSYGTRDREYPLERTGAPRVLVIGDSVTFGSGVAPEARFTNLLEAQLSRRFGSPVEVMNFGIGGYDTLQEVLTLEEDGLRFSPDLVMLAYCVNDAGNNSPNLNYIRRLRDAKSPFYRLRSVQLVRTSWDRLELMRRLQTDNEEGRFAERFRGVIEPVSDIPGLAPLRQELTRQVGVHGDPDFRLEWYQSDAHLGKVEFALRRLRELSEEHGFALLAAILPHLDDEQRENYEIVYRMVAQMMRAQGIESIVVSPAFPANGLESLRSREGDAIHPDERGHELIAQALEPRLAALLAPLADL